MENNTRERLLGQTQAAKALVSLIPDRYFIDPNTTFVDPAMGGGQYLAEVVKRCEKYHTREQVMPRIYGAETLPWFTNRAKLYNKLSACNLTLSNKPFENMKSKVIIGNPPYQDVSNKATNNKLWMKFVDDAFDRCEEGGIISLVTPTSFVGNTAVPARNRRRLLKDFNLTRVDYTAGKHFTVGVDICFWTAIKEPYSGKTLVVDELGERYIDLREELPMPQSKKFVHTLSEKIGEIISRDTTSKLQGVWGHAEESENGYTVFWSGRNKKKTVKELPDNVGKLKVVASYSASYRGWFITSEAVAGWNRMWMVDSVEEGLELGSTFSQPVLQFFMDTWRKTAGYTPAIRHKSMIPDLRGMTNNQINELFELTPDEISYIYSNHSEPKQMQRVINA